ncbi:MAG: hypothetical protein LUD48_03360, partial [Prevotella sp.]|nr:hypothetical protein [Prevotella sp.]
DNGERFNYPFPMKWDINGLAFYDGSLDINPKGSATETGVDSYTYHTGNMSWNTYGIVNYYVGNLENKDDDDISPWEPTCKEVKKHEGNWLYINPTDRPAEIAELTFEKGDLAMGSKLLVSAWMRNANVSRTDYDASVLFTLYGVKADGTEEPIHRSNSGQIESTNGSVALSSESDLSESVLGKGTGTNEWYQVFFTYELKEEDAENYTKFTIRVNNSCSGAQGGGYYFDELKVYESNPTFEVTITPIDEVRSGADTPMRLDINYADLMDCLGLDPIDYTESSTDTHSLDFILINKDKYEASIGGGATAAEALSNSIVDISYLKDSSVATASTTSVAASKTVVTTQNPGVKFYCHYDNNSEYDATIEGYNFPMEGFLMTRESESGTSMLSADFNANVSADSTYLLLVNLLSSDDDSSVNAETISSEKLAATFAGLVETQYTADTVFAGLKIEDTRDGYQTSYSNDVITEALVAHKAGRWYQNNIVSQRASDDDFDSSNSMVTLANETEIQATHTYVDTIYMRKGSSMELMIPNSDSDDMADVSMNNYYRWFNYLNDQNFYVGNGFNHDDLLTIGSDDSYKAWVFSNGYVSGLLNTSSTNTSGTDNTEKTNTLRKVTFYYPTDDEYITYIESRNIENFEGQDNSYYAVACDLSNYTDFATTFTAGNKSDFSATNNYCEPTLQERVLFYIVGVNENEDDTDMPDDLPEQFQHYWSMLNNSAYQGGGYGTSTKYLEEHEITFPSQRLSGNTKNDELVMLSKDAQAYGIPGQSGSETLKVEFASDDNSNGLSIATGTSTLSGTDRVIQFYKGTSGSQWSVDDGSTATILVTKEVGGTTYNIARYKLTFKKESIALTEAQVDALDKQQSGTPTWDSMWWNDLGERGATYLGNCDLVASLDFDYSNSGYDDNNVNSSNVFGSRHGERFNYPFPMDWSSSSVAFYDGSLDINPLGSSTVTATGSYTYHTGSMLWNTYGIVNYYVGNLENKGSITQWEPKYKNVKTHTGNWLYVNPTDKPSTIAELPFEKTDLAEGTEIFVTAWMRNANASRNNPDASVVLALMGVKSDGTEIPIYSVNSGQIESTNGSVALSSESSLDASITGKGSGTNEWYQVFFSYTIKGGSTDLDQYDHFAIKVTNNSLANQGGYYFDELKVYKKDPTFDVRITPIEDVLSNTYTPMRVDIDYGTMMTCFGLNPNDYTESSTDKQSLDFILINKDKYDASVSSGATAVNALKSSIVDLSYVRKTATLATASTMNRVASSATTTDPTTTVTTKNPGVEFYCYLGNNDEYDSSEAGYNYALDGLLFKNSTDLSADFNADVSAGSTYMIIVHLSTSSDDSSVNAETITDDKLSIFASLIGTQYTNTTTFATGTTVDTDTRSGYNLTYNGSSIKDVSIKHKAARWYQKNIRGQQEFEDSFDDDNPMETIANGVELQSAHIYVDTIYLTKGTSIDIEVPNKFTAYGTLQLSMDNYYRWFNYQNDKNFYVGEEFEKRDGSQIYDLLTKYNSTDEAWAFENGYVSGWLNKYTSNTTDAQKHVLGKITFYYPTDNEFNTYIGSRNLENFEGMDNSYYALACDMSNYTDFYYTDETTDSYVPGTNTSVRTLPTFGDNSTYYEPTLEIRALFYIVGVDSASTTMSSGLPEQFQHYWSMLKEPEYQGGTDADGKKYLEEYEINMPSQRISQNYNNDEVVALSKEARSYAIPGETGEETLDVAFASGKDNGLAILSSTRSLSGDVRVIQFYKYSSDYASDDSNSGVYQWSVEDGSTATILVTKTVNGTTYNIARFKLTFKYESIPLTEAQLAALDEKDELGETTWNKMWWNDMTYRSPSYLENNYTLITSLDFDYGGYGDSDLNSMTVFNNAAGNSSSAHGERFAYPFPLKWNNCSYAFFDGSFDYNPLGTAKTTPLGYTFNSGHTSWGAYAIVNYYVGNGEMNNYINYWEPKYPKVKNHSGNWLYL